MLNRSWQIKRIVTISLSVAVTMVSFTAYGQTELTDHNAHIARHPTTGKVRFIGARPHNTIVIPGTSQATPPGLAGRQAVERYASLFGVTRVDEEIRLVKDTIKPWRGSRHRYWQVFQGVPILAGELLVNLDESRRLISMTGEISPDLSLSTRPRINSVRAMDIALEAVAKWYDLAVQELKASQPELWIVDPRLIVPSDRPATLTWRMKVTSKGKLPKVNELVFVDAQHGGITLHINLIVRIKNRETYDAGGTSILPGTLVCDESDPDCVVGYGDVRTAHINTGDTYDFYFNEHERDSIDGAGQTLVSTVYWNDGFNCPNAFWDGAQMVYCDGMAADDVVAHEFTHGVTQHTSNLLYYYQSGAINESLSDIWGEFVDLTNSRGNDIPAVRWKLGEDLPAYIGITRDMANPPAFNDPDRMSSPLYQTASFDNGGVHTNSGVNNKAAYLMTDGGTFNGYSVRGLGISKVADIYYEIQTNLLVSGSDYADLYEALNQGCLNLVGVGNITQSDCEEVRKATEAVEMNTDPLGFNPEAAICPPGTVASDLFFDDFENGTARWNFTNLAGAGTPAWIEDNDYATSGDTMLWGRDSFTNTDAVAEFKADVVLPVAEIAYLHFRHAFGFEYDSSSNTYWDGGWIEYSTDGGVTWNDAGAFIDDGQTYNGTLASNNPNPLQPAFGSESHGYVSTRLDLSSLAGQSVRFRWRSSTDQYVSGPLGWVVDDVSVYTCSSNLPPNQPPRIESVSATPSTITDVATSDLSATATDTDGPLPLIYTWSVNPGEGTIVDPHLPNATYIPPNVSNQQVFALTVNVDDGSNVTSTLVNVIVQNAGGDIPLIPGITDGGEYGNNYGSNQNETVLEVAFEGTGTDLQLSVSGYDIDLIDEVAVYLNGDLLGYLSIGPNNSYNSGDVFLIPASQQLSGINIVELRQKLTGETWGVTNLLLDTFPDVSLTVGITDTGEYGWSYGSREHETGLTAAFQGTGVDLKLSVKGFDIDLADEVAVYLNGHWLGHLSTGPDNDLNAGDTFLIPASQQLAETNVIEFRVKVPGYKWGVTNLLLDNLNPDVILTIGVTDTGEYGWSYGSRQHEAGLTAVFQNIGVDLELSVTGYDIDLTDEVAVYLNGYLLGYLSVGPNEGFNAGDTFLIRAADQLSGTNMIEFRVDVPGYKWGITNLLLDNFVPDVTLDIAVMDTGEYGWGYGSRQHEAGLIAAFQNTGSDLELSVTGYDIDLSDEVAVYLNGYLLGYLSVGPNEGFNAGDTFLIRAAEQLSGTNMIEFRVDVPGYKWGITNLLLDNFVPDVLLTVAAVDTGEYGWGYGSRQHKAGLTAAFQNIGVDLELSVTGYDIDLADEVAVYLNGHLLGYLSVGPNNGFNSGDVFPIFISQQLPGTNIIELRQKVPGYKWGVTNLLLDYFVPDVTLAVGIPDTGAYGWGYGSRQHEAGLTVGFQDAGVDVQLSLTGYDIDLADEVAVYLNGELLDYLSTGPNNGLNAGDIFVILAYQQRSGMNVIELRQKVPGYKWGVTNLLLSNY
jgi:Zn-dependent metalloprotease/ABC-type amino acid transport substrate-binding protein